MLSYDPETGDLDLDMSSVSPMRLRLSSWAAGLDVRRLDAAGDEPFDGDLGIPLAMLTRSGSGGAAYVESIPLEIRQAVACFPWRQWILLRLLRRDARTREILATAPVIAWLVADAVGERQLSLDEAAGLLLERRRDILGLLGFPATEWAVRLLSRVRFVRYLPDGIADVRALLGSAALVHELRARPGLVAGESVRLMMYTPEVARLPFVCVDASSSPCHSIEPERLEALMQDLRVARPLVHDLLAMHDELGRADLRRALGSLRTLDDLRALHDRLAVRIHALDDGRRALGFEARWGTTAVPPPPLPGTEAIVPITSFTALAQEGRAMGHCVGSYGDRVMSGKSYIYQVLQPERATLELLLSAEGPPLIGQLVIEGNRSTSQSTRDAVTRWVAGSR